MTIKKNVLDIEERIKRNYFSTTLIIGFTLFLAMTSFSLNIEIMEKYRLFVNLGFLCSLLLIYVSFAFFKVDADKKLNEIKELKPPTGTKKPKPKTTKPKHST